MILVKGAFHGFKCKFSAVFIINLILHAANGNFEDESFEYPDVFQSFENIEASSFFNTNENALEDNEYPFEILEKIVEETYELLESDDEEAKRKLKMDPSDYMYYLYASKLAGSEKIPTRTKSGKKLEAGCPAKNALHQPRRTTDDSGTEYIVVNVENLEQYVKISKCVNRTQSCGNQLTGSYLYESVCEQVTERIGLIGIPVGKELVKENQEVQYFLFPTKCACNSKRIRQH